MAVIEAAFATGASNADCHNLGRFPRRNCIVALLLNIAATFVRSSKVARHFDPIDTTYATMHRAKLGAMGGALFMKERPSLPHLN